VHEVVDGGALLEELRVGDDDERLLGVLGDDASDALGGADRDGALVDDDRRGARGCRPISAAAWNRKERSAALSEPSVGVPTARKMMSPWAAASALLVVKRRRPAAMLCSTSGWRPGSKMGSLP
jgi:hypothetical protein